MDQKDALWKVFQEHMEYSDDELEEVKKNPDFAKIIAKYPELNNYTIVAEVIKSRGCNSQHKVGTKFYFDPFGNLLTHKNPKKICIFAIMPIAGMVIHISEQIYAGRDPNEIVFRHYHCADVGPECGGWGEISVRVNVERRK